MRTHAVADDGRSRTSSTDELPAVSGMRHPIDGITSDKLRIILIAILVAMLSGCRGERRESVYPVRGMVLFDDRPLAEAQVVFHPVASAQRSLLANTNTRGEFSLTTYEPNDGAPAGEYRVTVEYRELVQEGDEMTRTGANLLPTHYASQADSGLRCTVNAEKNHLEPFRLKSR